MQGIACTKYVADGKHPQGCPEDPSWTAFERAGWTVRFLDDYTKQGAIKGVNPNTIGMVEVIVCSKAEDFAGNNIHACVATKIMTCIVLMYYVLCTVHGTPLRFAGTYYSSFTGYIHRLRGYHGIGEQSYYHSTNRVTKLRMKKSVGHGFSREWRAGWTDDEGGLI